MNRKILFPAIILFLFIADIADAQMIIRRRGGGRLSPRQKEQLRDKLPKFEPAVNLSVGYGFPNLDKDFFPAYYDAYRGSVSQTGPLTASLDYQFSRRMSIGIMVSHGTVNAPYYDYYSATSPVFHTKLESWSFMLNLVRYIPVGKKVTPYLRTAIGINSWSQEYTDADHNEISMAPADLPDLAYQAGIGAKFNLSKNAGLFAEAGYGKYIVQAGLAVKF